MADAAVAIEAWRHDIVRFAQQMFDASPTPQQIQILRAMAEPGAHVSVRSGHGIGKSSTSAWLVLHALVCYPECKIPATAPTGHQLHDILWPEIALWHSRMPPMFKDGIHVGKDTACVIGREQLQFAVARTARREVPDALQGFHSPALLFILDEASGIPDEVYRAAEGALSSHGARVLLIGNPVRLKGYFYDTHNAQREHWTRFRFSSEDSPLADPNWLRKMADTYGVDSDEYRMRVLGEFPRSEAQTMIGHELAARMVNGRIEANPFAPGILGVDPAWMGGDRSVIAHRQGLEAEILFCQQRVDNLQLAGQTAAHWRERRCSHGFVDQGWGAGVIDILRGQGYDPTPVSFGGKPINVQRFADKRTEMWVHLKEWGEAGGAIKVSREMAEDMIADLTSFTYSFTVQGKLILESKDSLKKRGLPSPDMGDGVALTHAFPVEQSAAPGLGQDLSRLSRAKRQQVLREREGAQEWSPV